MNENELTHYGVPGMKWGKRKVRGHAGPGVYLNRKRQLAGDKKDLEYLNKGGHLSVGLTKKRQAAYDAKDKARLEKRIAKNERKNLEKEYGNLEDQMTYGKKADKKKNASLQKKMKNIESKLNALDKSQRAKKAEKGRSIAKRLSSSAAFALTAASTRNLGFSPGISVATGALAKNKVKARQEIYDEYYNRYYKKRR